MTESKRIRSDKYMPRSLTKVIKTFSISRAHNRTESSNYAIEGKVA